MDTAAGEKTPLVRADDGNLPRSYKVLRTLQLFCLWVIFGCYCEITGPVIPELIVQTHSDYQIISQGIAMRGAGHALGGIFGGLTVDRYFSIIDVLCFIWTIMYVGVSVTKSYVTSVPLLFITFLFQGALETVLHTAGYRILHKTWRDKAAVPFHVLNVGYGVGSITIPFIVKPYLDPRFSGQTTSSQSSPCDPHNSNRSMTTLQAYTIDMRVNGTDVTSAAGITTTASHLTLKYPADFVIAYWILAPFGIIVAFGFIANLFYSRRNKLMVKTKETSEDVNAQPLSLRLKNSIKLQTCSPKKPVTGLFIIIMVALYTANSTPIARVFPKYIFSYARDGPCMTVAQSIALQSAYFAAVTGGKLFGCIFSAFLSVGVMMQIGVFGVLGSSIGLYLLKDNSTSFQVLCCTMGFFTGPICSTIYAWANRYVELTAMAQIIPELGAAAGDIIMLMGLGWSYQTFGPYVLWPYMIAFCAGLALISWILQALGCIHGDRFVNQR